MWVASREWKAECGIGLMVCLRTMNAVRWEFVPLRVWLISWARDALLRKILLNLKLRLLDLLLSSCPCGGLCLEVYLLYFRQ